jgi:hypothetical protein
MSGNNAGIDENSRQTLSALSYIDGKTIVPLYGDPSSHRLLTLALGGLTNNVSQILGVTAPDNGKLLFNNNGVLGVTAPGGLTVGTTTITSGTNGKILYDNNGVVGELTNNFEVTSNKATDFTTINNTLYPTVEAVNNQIITSVTGLLDYRGSYNASGNTFPATGGSGTAGAILKGDFWICSVAGTLGGTSVTPGDLIIALVDTPGQTSSNWDLVQHDINGAYVTTDQTVGQTIGATGARLNKLWATDITVTNAITGSVTGNAGTVTNGVYTTGAGSVYTTPAGTETLTNKRITPRIFSTTTLTTNTGAFLNGDTFDMFMVTAQEGALKFLNPSGTPTDGQKLILSVASSTTAARALTWDTAYSSSTVTLPSTTAATTAMLTIGFIYSASKTSWICVAVA